MLNWLRPFAGPSQHSVQSANDNGRAYQQMLDTLCAVPKPDAAGLRARLQGEHFQVIAQLLEQIDRISGRSQTRSKWSLRPRLYMVLHSINAVNCMDSFIQEGRYDIELPYDANTLPNFITDLAQRARFLRNQECVLTEARKLETPGEHIHFGPTDQNHFLVLNKLGQGGYGSVDVVMSKLSLKVFARKKIIRTRETNNALKAMIEEINITKQCTHRHLIKILGSYTDQKHIAYLMEPVADCNLSLYLKQCFQHRGHDATLRQFFGCLAGAMEYLHQNKIRHRDIKPENILVKQEQVYIADFGNALSFADAVRSTTLDRNAAATPFYMAPEVACLAPRNAATDMFSLGIVFLEIMTVLKGIAVSEWQETIRKKARRENKYEYVCLHLDAVTRWLEKLGSHGDHPEHNEPLLWIKELVQAKGESRLTAHHLVRRIVESASSREHCCIECYHDWHKFDNSYYTESSVSWTPQLGEDAKLSQHLAEDLGLMDIEPGSDVLERQSQTIHDWLRSTNEAELPINVFESVSVVPENSIANTSRSPMWFPTLRQSNNKTKTTKSRSSDTEVQADGARTKSPDTLTAHDVDLPLNIVEDSSSDDTTIGIGQGPGDFEQLPRLETIAEDDDCDAIPGAWPMQHEQSTRVYAKPREQDRVSMQKYLRELGIDETLQAPANATRISSNEQSPSIANEYSDPKADGQSPLDNDSLTAGDQVVRNQPDPNDERSVKPSVDRRASNATIFSSMSPPTDKQVNAPPRKRLQGTQGTMLSASNVGKLNASAGSKKGTSALHVFNASSYINDIWQQAEMTPSIASSNISDRSARLFNMGSSYVCWQDRDFQLVERFCKSGQHSHLKRLLKKQCNPGTVSKPRPKPLLLAIEGRTLRHVKCVKELVAESCDVNRVYGSRTPIHRLIEGGDFDGFHNLLLILLMAGADVNARDAAGDSALSKLFLGEFDAPLEEYKNKALGLMLNDKLPTSPDVDIQERATRNSLVHLAVQRKSPVTLALLIHKQARVDVQNAANITPIVMAANQWQGPTSPVQRQMLDNLLKASDVDVNRFGGWQKQTPLHCAVVAGCIYTTEVLLQNGADPTIVDGNGKTALQLVKQSSHSNDVLQELQRLLKVNRGSMGRRK